jgi:hypothetical protein
MSYYGIGFEKLKQKKNKYYKNYFLLYALLSNSVDKIRDVVCKYNNVPYP